MADTDASAPAVSDAQETPAPETEQPSGADTQAPETDDTASEATTDQPESAQPAEIDWDDPRIKERIDREKNAAIQAALARERRAREKAEAARITETQDADAALAYAARKAGEQPDDGLPPGWRERAAQAAPDLARLANKPEYGVLYEREGKAKLDARYARDPVAYAEWVDDQIVDIRAEKRAGPRAEALALDKANRALKNVPVPPAGGGGSSGGLTLERYQAMSPEEASRLSPSDIDRLTAALNRS